MLAEWKPEDRGVLGEQRAAHRPAQSVDLDPGAAAGFRGLDGVVGGRRQAAGGRLQVHHRSAVLAGGAARPFGRDAAHLLLLHGADLRRPAVDHAGDLVADVPAVGIGFAVQNPDTPYFIFLSLALLCGLGGGNFASSMANISFFFPKAEKGNALALNAGLGNLGVSVVQFVVPLVITAGVFGWFGGDPQVADEAAASATLWLQNAGFIWVPFIVASRLRGLVRHERHRRRKASFADQAVIFKRKHNWIMCWLYTGTFGSFIGYSAGFPLLAKTQFPQRQRAASSSSSARWSARCRARPPAGCRDR